MIEPTFTPGPWTAFYKHKYNEWHVSVPIGQSSMRLGLFDGGIPTGRAADAHLVAAAPDLYEAAEAAWNCIAELPPTQARVEVAQMLCAALTKARGES